MQPLTEREELDIIEYYLAPNNVRHIATVFHRGAATVRGILRKHGIKFHSKEIQRQCARQQSKITCLDKYGVEYSFQAESVRAKSEQTCIEKYGVNNVAKCPEICAKAVDTCIKKYGVRNYTQTAEYLLKQANTCLKKYGAKSYVESQEHASRYEEIQNKITATNFEKFGAHWYSQTSIAAKTRITPYEAGKERFDSFPELCFYLFHREQNLDILRHPVKLEYYYENKKHYYFPDFSVNGELYELKGPQFVNEAGAWQNPFDHSLDDKSETKRQCAIQNGVKILYSKDYQKYIDWFFNKGLKKENFLIRKEK